MRKWIPAAIMSAVVVSLFPGLPSSVSAADPSLVRGAYGRDSSASGLDVLRDIGFNSVTVAADRASLDALADKGLKGIVWLGEYHRNPAGHYDDAYACKFAHDDNWIRQQVSSVAGHPAILAYQLSDEPTYARAQGCPAVEDHKRRAELIKSIDPSKPTYVTMTTWDGGEGHPYRYWVGVADILGLVVYPCSYTWDTWDGCQWHIIDEAVAAVKAAGQSRFIAVMQEFEDGWYRVPTADELRTQFDRWVGTGLEGYFLYHWNIADVESRPDHLEVMRTANSSSFDTSDDPETDEPEQEPPAPKNLRGRRTLNGVVLRWSSDESGAVRFAVRRDGRFLATTRNLRFVDPAARRFLHTYDVRAIDRAGNRSAWARTRVYRTALWRISREGPVVRRPRRGR